MKNYRIYAGLLTLALCGAGFATPRAAAQVNNNQIAILKWYGANRTTSFAVQNSPSSVAFDGANIWVANSGSNTVSKVRPSDGPILGTYTVGTSPQGLAFDGAEYLGGECEQLQRDQTARLERRYGRNLSCRKQPTVRGL